MNSDKVENKKGKRRKVVNVVELSDGELVYIRLDNGKKYLLNGDGCWRCGSTAKCFGNMDESDYELEVICEFDFFNEVRCLFLCLVKERMMKFADWLSERISGKMCVLIENLVDALTGAIALVNLKN